MHRIRLSRERRGLVKSKRGVRIALRVILALLLVSVLITCPMGKGQEGPKLSGALQRLLELRAVGASAAQAYAQTQGIEIRGPEERLTVVIEGVGDLSGQIKARGGILQAKYKGLWQAELPMANLQALAQVVPVSYIRLPQIVLIPSPLSSASASSGSGPQGPSPPAMATATATARDQDPIVSEGVALIGADRFHDRGITGQGVKVGVIDLGFAGLDRLIERDELPSELVAWNCRGGPCRRVSPIELSQASRGEVHGAAVAEILHDVAPDAELHLFLIQTEVELGQAMTQAADEGIKVINHSVAWFNDGSFYDGRGVVGDIVRTARRDGIFWVNAAGNFAKEHYEGIFQDSDNDRYHDTDIKLELEAGQKMAAFLTWDAWPRTHEDFDLFLERGPRQEAASTNRQNGTEPDEKIFFTASEGGTYRLRIKWVGEGSPPSDRRLELFLLVPPEVKVQPAVPESSLPDPANAAEAFAVGAMGAGGWEAGELEPFSSWGPTNDGREKPDLVGPDCVRTASYETALTASICGIDGGFPGTSAASPHVAGAAALLLAEDSSRTPDDLERLLKERAVEVPGRTANQVGAGRVSLAPREALPDLVIAAAQAEPQEVEPGARARIHAQVRNAGDGPAGPFWVALWLAEEEGLTGRELDSRRLSGLGPGEEQEVILEWAVPAEEPAGERRLVVVADPFGDVREQNEENNRQELTVRIRPQARPAFFAVGPISVSPGTSFPEGTTATFEAKITNQGDKSGTKTIEFSINEEGKESRSLTLGPGQSEVVRFSYTFTSAGRYTVRISSPDASQETEVSVEPKPPVLKVSPTSLSFSAKEGGSDPSPKALTITNAGGGLLEWQVTANVNWIVPGVSGGSLGAGQSFELLVFVHIQGLPAGTHKGVITISAPGVEGSPVRVEVTLTISS